LLVVLLAGCQNVPEVEIHVRECAGLPAGGRAAARACTLSGKGYVFAGRDEKGRYTNDLWQYDPAADSWSKVTNFPGKVRVSAAFAAYDGALYAGMGYGVGKIYADSSYLHDWWRWNPGTNTWDTLAPYPYETTVAPTMFVVGSRIYAIYGTSDGFSRQITYYDPKNDSWHSFEDSHLRALSVFGGVGVSCEGLYYFGLGNNNANITQWYRVDLDADNWTKLKNAPGKERTFSACAASAHHVYVTGGRCFAGDLTGGEIFGDILQYTPSSDQWAYAGDLPCGQAENQIAFAIEGKVYFGLGEDEEGNLINQMYCIEE